MKKIIIGLSILFTFISCNNKQEVRNKEQNTTSAKRIVVLSPPIYSMLKLFDDKDINVVGVNPRTFETANKELLQIISNGYQDIRTNFTSRDFSINKESLLLLKPDVVYYYGEFQKAGTDKMPLQSVNVDMQENDPEKITIQWEQLLSQSLSLPYKEIMKTQWNRTKEKCAKLKNNVIVPKQGLFVFSSLNGRITVSGKNTYGASYLEKAGISNVANSFSGNKEIGLEQLYAWAPNVVFLFLDSDNAFARSSKIQHSKNKMFIYHIPEGVFSWGSPCAESPLMPLWLFSRAYPQIYAHEDFKKDAKQFYTNTFIKSIPNRVINSVLMD